MATFEQRWITPARAAEYLRNQESNRSLSVPSVNKYARDMAAGNWEVDNGEAIKVNKEGQLLDGQHRMAAVVAADKLVRADRELPDGDPEKQDYPDFSGMYFDFAINVPDSARETMDIGRPRRATDFVTMAGGPHASRLVPIVTWHLSWLHGNYTYSSGAGRYLPTQPEIMAHWRQDADRFHTTMLRGYDANRQKLGATAPFGVAYHILRDKYGDELTETFYGSLVKGADLSENHPILTLRNQLLRKRYPRHIHLALLFRAWNYWIDGETTSAIYFKNLPTNENFPMPRDPAAKRTPRKGEKES